MWNKIHLARFLRRYPWLAKCLVLAYRQTRSRYTAGAVGVLIDSHHRLLLVEHVYHPRHPWGFAGGWVNRMEEPALTVVREFQEELGLSVRVIRPIWVQKSQYWGAHLDVAFLLESQTPLGLV